MDNIYIIEGKLVLAVGVTSCEMNSWFEAWMGWFGLRA